MATAPSITDLYRRVWRQVPARRRVQLAILFVLMVSASAAEIVSIGAVLPFLGVVAAPEKLMEQEVVRVIALALGLKARADLLLFFTVAFAGAVLVSASLRMLAILAQVRLANAIGGDFGIKAYQRLLHQPYAFHVERNSSEIHASISKANSLASWIIQPTLSVLSSLIILLGLLGAIFTISPVVALIAVFGFGSIYASIIFLTRRRMADYSRIMATQIGRINKATSEGLGGIRDVLIDGSQETYVRQFRAAVLPLHKAGAGAAFLDNSPRLGIEALGMLLIAGIAYSMAKVPDGGSSAVLVLGSLAVAAQRMLPVMQNLYSNYVKVRTSQDGVRDGLELLERPLPRHGTVQAPAPLLFRQAIEVADLHFRYSASTPWVLRGINLRIPRGSRVGFIGATGSGKSTLIDLLMGLLAPGRGEIRIDGVPVFPGNLRGWQAHLAHVPQSIYLADVSIAENIAFGVPADQIDPVRVRAAARQAQIADTIESWSDSYATLVGERGVRLSGGQRQRIGIARALYKQADVIVFDEATSALDNQTEAAVMESIEGLHSDLTLFIVAHRLTTLRGCDRIVELHQGVIRRVGTYQEIIGDLAPAGPIKLPAVTGNP